MSITYSKEKIKAQPFVKWVGGKRSIIDELLVNLPKEINHYYEPFLGGGALFFSISDMAKRCFLSDLNIDLIIAYNTIKDSPAELIELLHKYKSAHCEDFYYKLRAQQSLLSPLENSARFIYLMKTCYNGLYRVNKNNEFNTPIGNYKNPNICDKGNILTVSRSLQTASIKYQDFSKITPTKGDFVYFDPPYHPTTSDSFTKYLSNGFTEKDQLRLRDFALELSSGGVNVMISNSDANFILDIYKNHFDILKVSAPRLVNCKADKRGSVFETLIKNY